MEEFHGDRSAEPWQYKLLYGWGTLNTNIWLPSMIELVGYDPTTYNEISGVYYAAMQGLNLSVGVEGQHVVMQGGSQFLYFQQYNTSGGGEAIWNACNRQRAWTRSSVYATAGDAWRTTNAQRFDWGLPADAHAVHPAV